MPFATVGGILVKAGATEPTLTTTLPLAVQANITKLGALAPDGIAWASVSKLGSSLADLGTRSASDLTSGTLPDARFPAVLPAISGALLTDLPGGGGGGITDGDKGDIVVSNGGAIWTLDPVPNAKLAAMTTKTVKGRTAGTTGTPEDIPVATLKTDLALGKADVGLGNVDNTSDANKPISTAEQTALNLKAPLASPTFTGTVGGVTKAMVGLGNVDNTADSAKPVSTAQQAALDVKAPLASPAFTGSVSGITKAMVGLSNVDDTTDAAKPVSTAQQTALNLKANLANPTFTGTVTLPGATLADATDVVIAATTGSKIGQSGSKIGFFGVAPVVRPSALTQTYATASATHAAVTQLAAPAGGTGVAAGGWSTAANRDLAITSINAARTDIANLKNFVNQIVDHLQALGLLQ